MHGTWHYNIDTAVVTGASARSRYYKGQTVQDLLIDLLLFIIDHADPDLPLRYVVQDLTYYVVLIKPRKHVLRSCRLYDPHPAT